MYDNFLVVIPTYNESENIESLIDNLDQYNFHILIVDDNSPDKTFDIVINHEKFGNNLFGLLRTSNKGYGRSVIDGFAYALKNNYHYIVQMDSDFSHRIEDLISMCDLAIQNDLVIGSRYVQGGRVVGWSLNRRLLSKYANIFARFVIRSDIKDLTTGFRIYTNKLINNIDFMNITSNGYSFLVEIISKIPSKDYRIVEFPIVFVNRERGKSKMNHKIIFESFINLLKIFFKKN